MSSASCSTHPGRGKCCGNSRYDVPTAVCRRRRRRTRARRWCRRRSRRRPGHCRARPCGSRRSRTARPAARSAAFDAQLEQQRSRLAVGADSIRSARRARFLRRSMTVMPESRWSYTRRRGRRVKKPVENSSRRSLGQTTKSRVRRGEEPGQATVARHPRLPPRHDVGRRARASPGAGVCSWGAADDVVEEDEGESMRSTAGQDRAASPTSGR